MKRDMNPNNPKNWKIVCSVCGTEWFSDEMIDLVQGHFQKEHPDLETPSFNTIWVGIGPAPKPNQGNRAQRRKRRR